MDLSVLHSAFHTLKGVFLGRLVIDARNPAEDFWPSVPSLLSSEEYDVRPYHNVDLLLKETKSGDIRVKLSRLFDGVAAAANFSAGQLFTSQAKVYSLSQPTSHFQRLCNEPRAKEWMEKNIRHSPILLVVGLITLTDVVIGHDLRNQRQASASVSVPASDTLSPGISSTGLDGLEVQAKASSSREKESSLSFSVPDERVIGVRYRIVKFKRFSRKVENAFLKKNPNQWEMFCGGTKGSGIYDVLEAELGNTELDDLNLEEDVHVIDMQDEKIVFLM